MGRASGGRANVRRRTRRERDRGREPDSCLQAAVILIEGDLRFGFEHVGSTYLWTQFPLELGNALSSRRQIEVFALAQQHHSIDDSTRLR